MKTKYLIRLDDACPTMNKAKWDKVESILNKYKVKPMVGIIPKNQDKSLMIDEVDAYFWDRARNWETSGWTIALHEYDHKYIKEEGGLNPVNLRSEFAGVDLETQKEKVSEGYKILKKQGLSPEWFFAPSHTFDRNTLLALKEKSSIRKISDTFALNPYILEDLIFVPQQMGVGRNIKIPGTWTFCYHPNTMNEHAFTAFEKFIKANQDKFISFNNVLEKTPTRKSLIDNLLSKSYLFYRKMRR